MEDLLVRLAPGHPRLPLETPRLYRVSVPRVSLAPLSLVHPLMVSPFLAPETMWHMMHAKAGTIGMTQRVAPFLYWLRAAKIDPQQGIAALTRVDLADATLAKRQGIKTSLAPLPPPPQPPSQIIPLQQPFQMQAPAPPPAPTSQVVTPTERWRIYLRSLLRVFNTSTAAQLPDISRTVVPLKKELARAVMGAACRGTAEGLRFRLPRIPHAVAVMVMALAFHTKDPDGVGDQLNIFLFPDLSPSAGLESALLT